jgi:hypothetical protein
MSRCIAVDIGTGYISSAEKGGEEGKVVFRKVRDCFFKVDPSEFLGGANPMFGEKMLKKTGSHFIKVNGTLYILGDSAYKMAGTVHKEPLRPMSKGVLNPDEPESAVMVAELIKAVAGESEADDTLFFCVPAEPVDADYDVEFHRETLKEVFGKLGYKNINVMNEGLAVVFSELTENNFTGIGMSFGAGMVNICFAHMGMPILSFAISRGGDYIDQSAAKQVNDTANTITYHKEKGMSIKNPEGEYEKAIAVYYKTLLKYLVAQIKHLYNSKDKKELPNLFEPIPIVVAGGTSLVGDFIPTLKEIIDDEKDFPIPISEIRHAEEPLFAVSHGLYQASLLSSSDN